MRQFSALVSSKNCKNSNMQGRVPLYSAGDAAPSSFIPLSEKSTKTAKLFSLAVNRVFIWMECQL